MMYLHETYFQGNGSNKRARKPITKINIFINMIKNDFVDQHDFLTF